MTPRCGLPFTEGCGRAQVRGLPQWELMYPRDSPQLCMQVHTGDSPGVGAVHAGQPVRGSWRSSGWSAGRGLKPAPPAACTGHATLPTWARRTLCPRSSNNNTDDKAFTAGLLCAGHHVRARPALLRLIFKIIQCDQHYSLRFAGEKTETWRERFCNLIKDTQPGFRWGSVGATAETLICCA